jgi:hypothetical protein
MMPLVARTTVTLDSDVEAIVRQVMHERGVTFKQALNDAVRAGVAAARPAASSTPTFHLGRASEALIDKGLRTAGELEDDELVRQIAARR